MNELMTQLQPIIINAAVVIITTVGGFLGKICYNWVKEKIDTEEKKKVVESTVKYVNQIYKDLDGESKLQQAQDTILEQLNEKGIKITDLELRVLIEAAVNSFKDTATDGKVDNTKELENK